MKKFSLRVAIAAAALLTAASSFAISKHFITQYIQKNKTPQQVLTLLKEGNYRYVHHHAINYDQRQMSALGAKHGQAPYAFVLACIDSRSTPNIVFNQPVGSLFVSRIAGNPVTPYVIGGMEFATKFVDTKLIVIMGHTHCGAIAGACHGLNHPKHLGHLLQLLEPAVKQVQDRMKHPLNCEDPHTINTIAKQNVIDQMRNTVLHSPVLADKVKNGEIKVVGAMQNTATGQVQFFNMAGEPV